MQNQTPAASSERPKTPPPVTLTEKAVEMVRQAMKEEDQSGAALRVGVISGGCCGLQYRLDLTDGPVEEDVVYEQLGVSIYVDRFSAAHLSGTVIDYVDEPSGSGFKLNNPNVGRSCGCGASLQT